MRLLRPTGFSHLEILPLATKTLPPYTTTNAILVGGNRFLLIDPGPSDPNEQLVLAEIIEQRQRRGHHLVAVLFTHHHGDHVGAASFLAERFMAPLWVHELAPKKLKDISSDTIAHKDKITLEDMTLEAIHTPGHAPDHLVFYERRQKILIAGDMIADRGVTLIPPMSGSLREYLNSLDVISKLAIDLLIPAHGEPIRELANNFLRSALYHRYRRIKAVMEALKQSFPRALEAKAITRQVYGGSISDELMIMAELSVASSLKWLMEADLVVMIDDALFQALENRQQIEEQAILSPLKEIDERLRNP